MLDMVTAVRRKTCGFLVNPTGKRPECAINADLNCSKSQDGKKNKVINASYMSNKKKSWGVELSGKFLLLLGLFLVINIFIIDNIVDKFALAAGPGADVDAAANALIKPFCYIIELITGTVGKTIIVLILISLVIMLFLGKVSWGLALTFLFGVGLLFSAPTLVDMLGGGKVSGKSLTNICDEAMKGV